MNEETPKLSQKEFELMKSEVERINMLSSIYENHISELQRKVREERNRHASCLKDRDDAFEKLQRCERSLEGSQKDIQYTEKKLKVASDERDRLSTAKWKLQSQMSKYSDDDD